MSSIRNARVGNPIWIYSTEEKALAETVLEGKITQENGIALVYKLSNYKTLDFNNRVKVDYYRHIVPIDNSKDSIVEIYENTFIFIDQQIVDICVTSFSNLCNIVRRNPYYFDVILKLRPEAVNNELCISAIENSISVIDKIREAGKLTKPVINAYNKLWPDDKI